MEKLDASSPVTARTIFIEGHVQGVFFREWTVTQANALGITGWVRNRSDGRVEVYARGDVASLHRLTDLMFQGSPASRVDRVTVSDAPIEHMNGFSRRGTI